MKRFFPLAIVLAACSTGTDTPDDTDSDTQVDDTALPADTDVPTSCTQDAPATGSALFGTVVDADNHALGSSEARIQFCRDVCYTAQCRGPGVWGFEGLASGKGSFEAKPLAGDDDLATVFLPLDLAEGSARPFAVELPRLSPAVAIPATAAPLEVTPGLFLTLGTGDLATPPLEPDATSVAAVDGLSTAPPIDGIDGTVLAVYYFSSFNYPAADETDTLPDADHGIPYEIVDAWTLGAGAGEVWIGEYDTQSWHKVGDLIEGSVEGRLTTTNHLPKLSTVVVVRKPLP